MARKSITIGSKRNYHLYQDDNFPYSMELEAPIDITVAGSLPTNVVRFGDITGLGTVLTYTITAGNLTLDIDHVAVEVVATPVTITLPLASLQVGKFYIINNSSAGDISVKGTGSETINSELVQTVPSDSSMSVISNGTNWRIF